MQKLSVFLRFKHMAATVSTWAASVLLKLARFQRAEARSERFLKLAAEARTRITEISPSAALTALHNGTTLIDVREREEFLRGHIAGAISLSKGTIELEIENVVPNIEEAIIVYCGGGNRSALVADNLQRMGYLNIKSISGGFQAWLDAGLTASGGTRLAED